MPKIKAYNLIEPHIIIIKIMVIGKNVCTTNQKINHNFSVIQHPGLFDLLYTFLGDNKASEQCVCLCTRCPVSTLSR